MTKPEADRLERIATAMLAGLSANPDTQVGGGTRERVVQIAIARAQELIKQLDALIEPE